MNLLKKTRAQFIDPHVQKSIVAIIVGVCVGIIFVLRYNWGFDGLRDAMTGQQYNQYWERLAIESDPKVGQQINLLNLKSIDGTVKIPQQNHLTALVYIGDCLSCVAHDDLEVTKYIANKYPEVHIYVFTTNTNSIVMKDQWLQSGLTTPLILDNDGSLALKLNARFNFRWYVFDKQGKLVFINKNVPRSPRELRSNLDQEVSMLLAK